MFTKVKNNISDITIACFLLCEFLVKVLFSLLICGVPLLLLAEWCFPDYVHVLNDKITTKTIVNLIEEKKYNNAIWLIEKKENTIGDLSITDLYQIKGCETEAQMAVANFKAAERCIATTDSIVNEIKKVNSECKGLTFTNDIQKARLFIKMNTPERAELITRKYYDHPKQYTNQFRKLLEDAGKDDAAIFSVAAVDQLRLIHIRAIAQYDYLCGRKLFRKEIADNKATNPQRVMDCYMNWAVCALKNDSVKDASICYNYMKKVLMHNERALELSTSTSLSNYMALAHYLHDENSAKEVLPYVEKKMGMNYSEEEIGYHEVLAKCIPYWDMDNDFEKSNDALKRQSEFFSNLLSNNFLFYGEEQRENLYNLYRPVLDASFTHLAKDNSAQAANVAYNNALFVKGLLLRSSEQILNAVNHSSKSEAKEYYEKLLSLKKEKAEYEVLGGLANKYKLWRVNDAIAEVEDKLLSECFEFRSLISKNKTTYSEVRKKLDTDEVCIEFVIDEDGDYYALVGKKNYKSPIAISLFGAKEIKAALDGNIYKDSKFANKLWAKLSPHLSGIKTIYYSPSGDLNRVALSAIHFNGKALLDQYEMVLMSSTADIKLTNVATYKSATLMGDIRYSATDSLLLSHEKATVRSGEAHNFLMPLDGDEIWDVNNNLIEKGLKTSIFTRLDATEDVVKALNGNSPDIIHLSTHGFYDPSYSANPMANSGLFFAGANRKWFYDEKVTTKEDGILTAEEIALLNLSGCQLVVLSACETGNGNIDNYEGVFGLQRAFKLAGVQSIIMSLWEVDNEATTLLMTSFYKEWLKSKDMIKSFHIAQNEVRKEYPDEYYWGGFVLVDGVR